MIREAAGAFDRRIEVDAPDELPLIDVDPVRVRVAHGGDIRVTSAVGEGTTVRISLPR